MAERRTLVSVDLDDLACYHAVWGLAPPSDEHAGAILERSLPRFLELFAELGVTATFFVIGRDLERDLGGEGRGAELLRQAARDGNELANHSHAHAYDLVEWPDEAQDADLRACDGLLRELGPPPQGFRAPGYTHDERLLRQVAALGYRYDSSALPSLPYYVAKLAAKGWLAARGRGSASLAGGLRSFVGSTRPRYREDLRLWRIPMSVSPVLRLPLIGTTVLAGPAPLRRLLRSAAMRADYFHLELHGMDLADPYSDGLPAELCARQPELRVPLATRRARLQRLLDGRGRATSIVDAL